MELILHKVCGHPAQQAVTLRRCTPDEAPAVYALQNEVHAAMPHPEWFVTDTLEHITGYITDSLCIGVWQGSRLGAYLTFHYCGQSPHNYAAFLGAPQAEWPHWANVDSAVVHLCGQSSENYAAFLGAPQSQWQHWANADSAVVHPDWRGNGLQRRMLEAALPLLPESITHLGATVSPANPYSLSNALACGFTIRARREMYGGFDRYLLAKEL